MVTKLLQNSEIIEIMDDSGSKDGRWYHHLHRCHHSPACISWGYHCMCMRHYFIHDNDNFKLLFNLSFLIFTSSPWPLTIIIIIGAFFVLLYVYLWQIGPNLSKYDYLQGSDHRDNRWQSGGEDCVRSWKRSALPVSLGHEPQLCSDNERLQKIGGGGVAQRWFGRLQHRCDEVGHVGGGRPAEGVRLRQHIFQGIDGVWCWHQVDQERQHFWEGVAFCPLLPRQSLVLDCRCEAWWSCQQWPMGHPLFCLTGNVFKKSSNVQILFILQNSKGYQQRDALRLIVSYLELEWQAKVCANNFWLLELVATWSIDQIQKDISTNFWFG